MGCEENKTQRRESDWEGQGGAFESRRLEKAILWEAEAWMTRESARKRIRTFLESDYYRQRGQQGQGPALQKEGQSGAGGQ